MKKVILLIVFALFLKPIFPLVEYVTNYDYITKVLCINKAKPKLQCNGKCHLMKELAKASESEKPIQSDKKDTSKQEIEILFFEDLTALITTQIYFHTATMMGDNYANLYFHKVSCSVFHPPITLA
ncbi:MAG: hypothetical protein IPN80_03480 [Flavobacterium sp.]|nr:hypothetical protein [Flavobacterium sp.]